jgi:hypothetical protein
LVTCRHVVLNFEVIFQLWLVDTMAFADGSF